MILKITHRPPAVSGVVGSLKALAVRHRKKLFITFFLVIAENVTFLLYPVLAGIAINAILAGDTVSAALYGLMVLFIWCIGAARRSVDTRTFARIYAGLAVSVVLAQRKYQLNHSTIAARVTLSREFVDFFEMHLPMLITSMSSLFGAAIMLLIIEFWAGIVCAIVVLILMGFVSGFTHKNELLFRRLNNRLEKEVDYVHKAGSATLTRHYSTLARLRIALSDREAWGYLLIGSLIALLFTLTIILMTHTTGITAGHIYSVMTYMWMFATSLDDAPQLLEKFSQLRDIGKRVSTSDETSHT
ncbi:ABC transporter six-transmembrane domain-containing protein [Enterobacter cloacae]|uniref:ABC transporter six-transmembrane domain-containing protein n=1 Tax=Enterobacter cloacae TaxID=550 RepID=UPI00062C9431|nr:ABC transporter six-transmembrane domain-containing protein [Enterobacter cloacae]ELE9011156.1 ABC transporter six-transmembrane domain-containing protein [Enterobacter cloacae]KKY84700.1 membrane protein [Enterobacter cloacae]MCK7316800.1 ABC transporter six-transmembrane domain-containing protein [Enterobacter cloacae]MDR9930243.1 ABC transporter six-transmembrane domain-containing protein [Enterobacter cloacae subsp. dissolvens]HCR2005525.1 ABC transporter six-transmembrane domain-contai